MHFFKKLPIVFLLLLSTTARLLGQDLFSGGDGSKDNPYLIATEADLRALATEVNKNLNSFAGMCFKQTTDISFETNIPIEPIGGPVTDGFSEPVGERFKGEYDGCEHKIYNLNLYDERQLIGEEDLFLCVGLFGVLGEKATVKNVVIASGHIYGYSFVGGIAGTISEGCTITRCKIGPDVRIFSWDNAGGIAGTSHGRSMKITECANYANIEVHGTGIHKNAGGIIGSSANTSIVGCANFGDVWAKGGFAGGILGYMPISNENFVFDYPELKSCMNAGDISSMDPVSGGLIGCVGYNLSNQMGPIPCQLISNSYSYGQTMATFTYTYGPIVAFYLNSNPITVSKTFYNKDRYIMKRKDSNADAEIAFALGEAKSHAEITSPEFLTTLNDGGSSTFEVDKHKINGTMPILKWINETYDSDIDNPNQYRSDIKHSLYKQRAGSFFNPNRSGDFLIYDMSMQMPNIQAKSLGCNLDKGWIGRVLPIQGGKLYKFFMSSSAFRNQLNENGMYVKERPNKPADHWLITPSFRVSGDKTWFHWEGASEYGAKPSSYELYVIEGVEVPTPDIILQDRPVYAVDKESKIEEHKETIDNEPRDYYTFAKHKVDLSNYVGKEVRLAFRDRSIDKFNLLIGKMEMAQANTITTVDNYGDCVIEVFDQTLLASCPESLITLYSMDGVQLAQTRDQLVYQGLPGVYLLTVTDAMCCTEVHKVVLH